MTQPRHFIDLFAGCGGLSLGLMMSGWKGVCAVEQDPLAFKTLKHNLIDGQTGSPTYEWPEWLAKEPQSVGQFLKKHCKEIVKLKGSVELVAGGPPCQGFSFAGRRNGRDPRNELFRHHIAVVEALRPQIVLLENVQGIDVSFKIPNANACSISVRSYAERIKHGLQRHGYSVQQSVLRAVDFGIPQLRPRYFTVAIRTDLLPRGAARRARGRSQSWIFDRIRARRENFLHRLGLPLDRAVTVEEAISDLTTADRELQECTDPDSPPGFKEVVYEGPATSYQVLMHGEVNGRPMNSMRLVNHRPETVRRFQQIQTVCRKGVQISAEERQRIGIRKSALTPLAAEKPSHTITTLPDDLLHYSEPRIHTVREHARLQSFPDSFEFKGKFTTGSTKRTKECPRYTQVGNAVPPILALIIGEVLIHLVANLEVRRDP